MWQRQTHAHIHMFNSPLSGTTQVSRYQKNKTNVDFTEARDSEWQWHQLGHMQVCTSLQTDNHASTLPLSFYRPVALPAAQPTASKHWRGHRYVPLLSPNYNVETLKQSQSTESNQWPDLILLSPHVLYSVRYSMVLPSVLWCCWLGG